MFHFLVGKYYIIIPISMELLILWHTYIPLWSTNMNKKIFSFLFPKKEYSLGFLPSFFTSFIFPFNIFCQEKVPCLSHTFFLQKRLLFLSSLRQIDNSNKLNFGTCSCEFCSIYRFVCWKLLRKFELRKLKW